MMMIHLRESLKATFPARASEWMIAGVLFAYSFALAVNPDIFTSSPAWKIIASIMSQNTASWLCGIIGSGRLMVLAINGTWRRSPHLRATGAFLSSGLFFAMTLGIYKSGFGVIGVITFSGLMLLDTYNCLRAAGEAGISDDLYSKAGKNGVL